MASATIYPSTSDTVRSSNATFATMLSGSNLTIHTSNTNLRAGQIYAAPTYFGYEAFLKFDLSAIPAGSTINSVTFQTVVAERVAGVGNENVYIASVADFGTIDTSDWRNRTALQALSPMATLATIAGGGAPAVSATATFAESGSALRTWVAAAAGGNAFCMMWNDYLESGTAASASQVFGCYDETDSTAANRPQLIIDYTAPVVTQYIGMNHLGPVATLYHPSATRGAVSVGMQHLGPVTNLHQPSATPGAISVGMQHLGPVATLYQPVVTPGAVSIGMQHLSNPFILYQPSVLTGAVIAMQHLGPLATLHEPSVTVGAVAIGMEHLGPLATLHAPGVAQVIGMQHLANPITLYTPGVSVGSVSIDMQHLGPLTTLHQPGVTPGPVIVGMQHLSNPITLYQPGVTVGAVTIAMEHLGPLVVLYPPGIPRSSIPQLYVVSGPPSAFVVVWGPLPDRSPIARIDLDLRMHSVQWETGPGGWGLATIGDLRRDQDTDRVSYHLDADVLVPKWAHIEIFVNGVLRYEGRAIGGRLIGGHADSLRVMGYGAVATKDDTFSDPAGGAEVNSGVLLRQVIRNHAPLLRIAGGAGWTTVTTTHDPYEWAEMFPYDALQQVVAAAGVRWAVWEDRTIYLLPATIADGPMYQIPFTDAVDWDVDWQELATDARLTATDASGATRTVDVDGRLNPSALGGTTRRIPLNSSASLDVAQQWAQQHLAERATEVVSAGFTLTDYQPLTLFGGGTAYQEEVRYGDPVQIGDQPARLIERTDIDLWRGTLGVNLGPPSAGTLGALLLRTVETTNATRAGRDALTGGRRRR